MSAGSWRRRRKMVNNWKMVNEEERRMVRIWLCWTSYVPASAMLLGLCRFSLPFISTCDIGHGRNMGD